MALLQDKTGVGQSKNPNNPKGFDMVYRLRSIATGITHDYLDDGMDASGPKGNRQVLLRALEKTIVIDGATYPTLCLDEPLADGLDLIRGEVGSSRIPVITPEARAAMLRHADLRHESARRGRAELAAKIAVAEDVAKAKRPDAVRAMRAEAKKEPAQ